LTYGIVEDGEVILVIFNLFDTNVGDIVENNTAFLLRIGF
jgi:hypothetical protein